MSRRLAPIVASFVGVVVLALLWVLVTAEPNAPGDAYSPLIGQPAPAVVTTTIDDAAFDLSRRKGSWVVLNFFNSTCVPCINEHDELVAFADDQRNTPNPAELYTVVNDDSDVAVREFFTRNGGEWPKLRDENGAVAVAFGVARVPETWVIDPNGVVRLRITGELSTGLLDEQLASLRTAFGE
jgi:cytochrome c biogenesis protein CcmG/thiol:disulfide interchange protein DsbE